MKNEGFCRGKGLINISQNLDGGGGGWRVACEQALGGEWGRGGEKEPEACPQARRRGKVLESMGIISSRKNNILQHRCFPHV